MLRLDRQNILNWIIPEKQVARSYSAGAGLLRGFSSGMLTSLWTLVMFRTVE